MMIYTMMRTMTAGVRVMTATYLTYQVRIVKSQRG